MKNIQVIDGAQNCTYPIYAATDDEFNAIFPGDGQDIEFISDFLRRRRAGGESASKTSKFMKNIWERPVNKPEANGIHGTLFYELDHKKKYYPTKRGLRNGRAALSRTTPRLTGMHQMSERPFNQSSFLVGHPGQGA